MKKIIAFLIFLNIIFSSFSQSKNRNRDQEYLDQNTKSLRDEKLLKEKIIKILEKKEFTYRTKDSSYFRKYTEEYSQIENLSFSQNKVIYLMLMRLQNPFFVNKIGELIRKDVSDQYSELGGIVRFDQNHLIYFRPSDSQLKVSNSKVNNNFYLIPDKEDSLPKVAYFHLHSTSFNEREFSGPSNLDILITEVHLMDCNMVNEFVITSLEEGKFNIDYDGIDIKSKYNIAIVIDLGNYSYK